MIQGMLLAFIIGLALIGAGYFFARLALFPSVMTFEDTRKQAIELGWLVEERYEPWAKEEVTIPSPFGYALSAVYHPVEGSSRTVVISHGIGSSSYGAVKYAALFHDRGYNVLLYDLRHHGRSGGHNTTFGFYEKYDLKAVIDFAFSRLGPGGIVGTMGESMGAATTLQHAAIDPRVAFAIADCPYSDLPELFAYRLREDFNLPAFPLIPTASLAARVIARCDFREASPIRCVSQIEQPVLFIHGSGDSYIPPKMSVDLCSAKTRGYSKLYLAPGAGHVESVMRNPVEYDQQVGAFLAEIGLN